MKISNDWLKNSEIYKIFSKESNCKLDFSPQAKEDMYVFESTGKGKLKEGLFSSGKINGYAYGKKMLNITVAMWKEDMKKGYLYMVELYNEGKYPEWWLNKIFDRKKRPLDFIG